MAVPIKEMPGLQVSLDDVAYTRDVHTTPDRPHAFVYQITIRNDSAEAITVCGRKWVVSYAKGKAVTEGDGVDGDFPHIEPGAVFRYSGYHLVKGDSQAAGAYLVVSGDGMPRIVRIPSFDMRVPSAGK